MTSTKNPNLLTLGDSWIIQQIKLRTIAAEISGGGTGKNSTTKQKIHIVDLDPTNQFQIIPGTNRFHEAQMGISASDTLAQHICLITAPNDHRGTIEGHKTIQLRRTGEIPGNTMIAPNSLYDPSSGYVHPAMDNSIVTMLSAIKKNCDPALAEEIDGDFDLASVLRKIHSSTSANQSANVTNVLGKVMNPTTHAKNLGELRSSLINWGKNYSEFTTQTDSLTKEQLRLLIGTVGYFRLIEQVEIFSSAIDMWKLSRGTTISALLAVPMPDLQKTWLSNVDDKIGNPKGQGAKTKITLVKQDGLVLALENQKNEKKKLAALQKKFDKLVAAQQNDDETRRAAGREQKKNDPDYIAWREATTFPIQYQSADWDMAKKYGACSKCGDIGHLGRDCPNVQREANTLTRPPVDNDGIIVHTNMEDNLNGVPPAPQPAPGSEIYCAESKNESLLNPTDLI